MSRVTLLTRPGLDSEKTVNSQRTPFIHKKLFAFTGFFLCDFGFHDVEKSAAIHRLRDRHFVGEVQIVRLTHRSTCNTCPFLPEMVRLLLTTAKHNIRDMRFGIENAGFIALRIRLCSSPVTVNSPYPVTIPKIFLRNLGYVSKSIRMYGVHERLEEITLGYSNQPLTRIWCNPSGRINIIRSIPKGPTTRTIGPYCLTHSRCGMQLSPMTIVITWPRTGCPRGGPGTDRRGERTNGQRKRR